MLLNKILEQSDKPINFRRSSWSINFYLRLAQDGNIYIRNTGDPANGKSHGLSSKDILADDWEILELAEGKVVGEIYVNPSGHNFVYLNGNLYRLSMESTPSELYKVK